MALLDPGNYPLIGHWGHCVPPGPLARGLSVPPLPLGRGLCVPPDPLAWGSCVPPFPYAASACDSLPWYQRPAFSLFNGH